MLWSCCPHTSGMLSNGGDWWTRNLSEKYNVVVYALGWLVPASALFSNQWKIHCTDSDQILPPNAVMGWGLAVGVWQEQFDNEKLNFTFNLNLSKWDYTILSSFSPFSGTTESTSSQPRSIYSPLYPFLPLEVRSRWALHWSYCPSSTYITDAELLKKINST